MRGNKPPPARTQKQVFEKDGDFAERRQGYGLTTQQARPFPFSWPPGLPAALPAFLYILCERSRGGAIRGERARFSVYVPSFVATAPYSLRARTFYY